MQQLFVLRNDFLQDILHGLATIVRWLGVESDFLHRKFVGVSVLVGEALDFVERDVRPVLIYRLADFHAVRIVHLRDSPIIVSHFSRDIQSNRFPCTFDGVFQKLIYEFVGISAGGLPNVVRSTRNSYA